MDPYEEKNMKMKRMMSVGFFVAMAAAVVVSPLAAVGSQSFGHQVNGGINAFHKKALSLQLSVQKNSAKTGDQLRGELLNAVAAGNNVLVRSLLAQGADVSAHYANGTTALMTASFNGYADIVTALLSYGADVNAPDTNGETALMLASGNDHATIVKILLAHGANINAENNNGVSALMIARNLGHANVVKILKKATRTIKDNKEKNDADTCQKTINSLLEDY